MWCFHFLHFLFFCVQFVFALPKTRVIEDTDGQIVFLGGGWNKNGGRAKPDASRISGGSWHDGTQDWSRDTEQKFLEVSFRGSGIELFCVIANNVNDEWLGSKADYEFVLDGVTQPNHYRHTKSSGDAYLYQQSIFRKTGLSEGDHKIRVNLIADHVDPAADDHAKVAGATLIMFDSAQITFDDGTSPPNTDTATSPSDPKSKTDANTASGTSSQLTSGSASATTLNTSPSPSSPSSPTGAAPITGNPTDANAANTSPNLSNQTGIVDPTTKKTSLGPIIGGVVGGLIALILACFLVFCLLRRRRRQPNSQSDNAFVGPYMDNATYTDAPIHAPPSTTSNSYSHSRENSRLSLLKPVRRMDGYSDSSESAGEFVELTSTSSPNLSSQSPTTASRNQGTESVSGSGSGSARSPSSQNSESVSGSGSSPRGRRNPSRATEVRNMLQEVEDLARELRFQQQLMDEDLGPPPSYDAV